MEDFISTGLKRGSIEGCNHSKAMGCPKKRLNALLMHLDIMKGRISKFKGEDQVFTKAESLKPRRTKYLQEIDSIGILVYSVLRDKEMPLLLEMNKRNVHVELIISSSITLLAVVMPL